jgi:hypothetical protein
VAATRGLAVVKEETVRYWGETEADRQAAFATDSAVRARAGWTPLDQITEFAFGKTGMDLVVTYRRGDGSGTDDGRQPRVYVQPGIYTQPAPPPAQPQPAPAAAPPWSPSPSTLERTAAPAGPADSTEARDSTEETGTAEDADAGSASRLSDEDIRALYGENGADVAWLIDSLPSIDIDTARALADAYAAVPDDDRDRARATINTDYADRPFCEQMQTAEKEIRDWLVSLHLAPGDQETYEAVAEGAMDAVDALIVEDQLDDDSFDALYGPWQDVMEPDSSTG